MVLLARCLTVLICSILFLGCGHPYRSAAENVPYGPEPLQQLDVYVPRDPFDSDGPRRTVLAIHGGAWETGDKNWGKKVAEQYAQQGYVVVAINYRLAPKDRWPAQLEDCKAALSWIRRNAAAFRIDPDLICAFGVSAGGHLATMLALTPGPTVGCVVESDGETDLTVYGEEPIMADEDRIMRGLLGPGPWSPELLADCSPINYVEPTGPPILVIHATGDANVYYSQGQRLSDTLESAGVPTSRVVIHGAGHGRVWEKKAVLRAAFDFLDQHLRRETP